MEETFVCFWCGKTFGPGFEDFAEPSLCKYCSGELEEEGEDEIRDLMNSFIMSLPREYWDGENKVV